METLKYRVRKDFVPDDVYELAYPVQIFTGRLDKNGKEIFEGDLVEGKKKGPWDGEKYQGKVTWCNKRAGFFLEGVRSRNFGRAILNSICDIEIIG